MISFIKAPLEKEYIFSLDPDAVIQIEQEKHPAQRLAAEL